MIIDLFYLQEKNMYRNDESTYDEHHDWNHSPTATLLKFSPRSSEYVKVIIKLSTNDMKETCFDMGVSPLTPLLYISGVWLSSGIRSPSIPLSWFLNPNSFRDKCLFLRKRTVLNKHVEIIKFHEEQKLRRWHHVTWIGSH